MKTKIISLTLSSIIVLSFLLGCSNTESTIKSHTSEVQSQEQVQNTEAVNKEYVIFINGIVKYQFTKSNDEWTALLTQFDSGDPNNRKVVKTYTIVPKLGWDDFEDMVNYLKIESLPNQTDIKSRKASNVSNISRAYEFTIYNGNTTRHYAYYNPEGELGQNWESQNVVTFGTYLVSELSIIQ